MPDPILITHWRSPGDIICLTAAVRDLCLTYPGRFEIHVGGSCGELWQGNPHVAGVWGNRFPRGMPRLSLDYEPWLARSNEIKLHFLTAFHRSLEQKLSLPLQPLKPFGDLHLSPHDREHRPIDGRYWLLISGGKTNLRAKIWPAHYAQQLVNRLLQQGIAVVQIGASFPGHEHHFLENVVNLVGRTSLRDVLRLLVHADGLVSPVTFAMHAAAALEKPCVVVAGGREPWWWEAYLNSEENHFGNACARIRIPHRFLHTQGLLDCCQSGGCWKTHVQSDCLFGEHDCVMPVSQPAGPTAPQCLTSILPEVVAEAVLSYYHDQTLPPLGPVNGLR